MNDIKNIVHSKDALCYAIKHLFKVAGLDLNRTFLLNIKESSCELIYLGKKIIFHLSSSITLSEVMAGKYTMSYIYTFDKKFKIPIIHDRDALFAEIHENDLYVNADLLSLTFIMLSRYEELISSNKDKYGRYKFENSLSNIYNFIDFPIADEYALLLRDYLSRFYLTNFETSKVEVTPTVDVDVVRRFGVFKNSIKSIIGDIVIYKNINSIIHSIIAAFRSFNNPFNDPYIQAIDEFVKLSLKYKLNSIFYFMGAKSSEFNNGYKINQPFIINAIDKIINNGMKVGIHGGYDTYMNETLFFKEKLVVEEVIGFKIKENRQHYLRFDVNYTFDILENSGILQDSSLGYAEREGFRCGTCHEYHPFNFNKNQPYSILEKPLIVMEVTLFNYRKLNNSAAYEKIMHLYSRCKLVGGNFIFLLHNDFISRDRKKFNDVYLKFFKSISR